MFWNRDKTVRVELVNPEIRLQTELKPDSQPEPPRPEPRAQATSESTDFVLKLITLFAVAVQGGLAIYGYSVLAGSYAPFGIIMSELEIGLPALLFYGYLFVFMDTFVPASQVPIVGPGVTASVFMIIASWIVWRLKRTSSVEEKLATTGIMGFLLFLIFVVPMFGFGRGQEMALEDVAKSGLPKSANHLNRTHLIPTNRGDKQGMVVAATAKYTFLLAGTEVLKIDNNGNKVVRVTTLSAKSDPSDTTKP